ncbi:MAG: beta-N-acetylhexosaminidase [Pseudolabrys sp.]|nr:beta-N-acetylhexosaminidase [Pseudolabrys sp.]MBV9956571.1 beta-N-acetylhexosaminidase [Pseudolabrys sp.]
MAPRAFITGLAGPVLSPDEKAFFRESDPWGFILFKRNISAPAQVSELTAALREAVGRDAPILVDQEGGRVQRLGPPHWPAYPPGATYARIYQRNKTAGLEAARLGARLIAYDLAAVGIDVDCLPLADVPVAGSDAVIGDRAYGTDPEQVAALAGAAAGGLQEGGVLPVLKHLPGHGRATADSHLALPTVDADRATLDRTDFAAFKPLSALPLGMTAHVVFSAIDPKHPATTSATMVREVIRGFIGFQGLLMSDDVSMGALSGTLGERSRAALAAGCDVVLHCNGKREEMDAVAQNSPELAGEAARRADAALKARRKPRDFDVIQARARFAVLIGEGGVA